jgi:uncharacterized protein YlxW (UPF0749 family)
MSDQDGDKRPGGGDSPGRHPGELPPEERADKLAPEDEPVRDVRGGDSAPKGRRDEPDAAPGDDETPGSGTGREPDSGRTQESSRESGAHGSNEARSGPDESRDGESSKDERHGAAEPSAAPSGGGGAERTGRQRLAAAVWPPRVTRAQLIVALLLFVLGLGLAIQVRSTSENSSLRGARQEDLVRILDELDDRTKRLEDEKQSLEGQRTELENSSDQAEEARRQTRQKARQLGVLAGTVGAQGPGIELTVTDPGKSVEADMLLDAVQELRAAGAEAIEVNNVRVVASTYFSDSPGGVRVDGHKISPPYRFEVIGKPKDLEPALNIPGGVVQTLRKEQADASVKPSESIVVDALRSSKRPDYARSSAR